MTSIRDRLTELAAIKAVKDMLAAREKESKASLMKEVGGRMGATGAVLPTGEEGATVSITAGKSAVLYVADERAFLEWVRGARPAAIVEMVRESDRKQILDFWLEHGEGEIPPGVELGDPGDPYVMVRQSKEQAAAVVGAWQAGLLELPGSKAPEVEG